MTECPCTPPRYWCTGAAAGWNCDPEAYFEMTPQPNSIALIPVSWRRSCHAAIALTQAHDVFDGPDTPPARRLSPQARARLRRWIRRQQTAGAAGLLSDMQLRLLDLIPAEWRAPETIRQTPRTVWTHASGPLRRHHRPATRTAGGSPPPDRDPHWPSERGRRNGAAGHEARRAAMAARTVPAAASALLRGNYHPRYAAVLRLRVAHPDESTRQLGARLGITAAAYDGRLRRALGLLPARRPSADDLPADG